MKNVSKISKIIASVLIICLGLVLIYCGTMDKVGTSPTYYWVDAEEYGGDAYTGIQNAAATTANYVGKHALSTYRVIRQAYVLIGIFVALLGLFLLGCALDKKDVFKSADAKEDVTLTLERVKALLDSGAITQLEYETMKRKLLGL